VAGKARARSAKGLTVANRIPQQAVAWFFIALFVFLLGNNLHGVWDRDEPRYCQATREMLETGDWIVPRFNTQLRYDKPVLVYWAMAPSMMVFGVNEFAARFPAALAGAARTVLIFLFALAMGCSARGARIAAAASILMSLLLVVSKAATTDSILVLTVTVAMFMLWLRIRDGFRWSTHLVFWAAIGAAILVKGPPGVTFVLLAWLVWKAAAWRFPDTRNVFDGSYFTPEEYQPRGQWAIRLAVGLLVMLAVAGPWAVLVTLKTNGDFLAHSIGRHVVGRNFGDPTNNHTGPVYYYLMTLIPSLLPLTGLALPAIDWARRHLASAQARFIACWFIPGFVVVSLVSTKLPHYPAPLYVGLCLLLGLWWTAVEQGLTVAYAKSETAWRWVGSVLVLCVGPALILAATVGFSRAGLELNRVPFLAVGGLFLVAALGFCVLWVQRRDAPAVKWLFAGWTLGLVAAFAWALPTMDSIRPSKALGSWMRENLPEETRVIAVEYQEPSLVFYWGRQVLMASRSSNRGQLTDEQLQLAPTRELAMQMLADQARPTVIVTTLDRWTKYQREFVAEDGGMIPPTVTVLHQGTYYQFEKGRFVEMVIAGNPAREQTTVENTL
jgi:4-amino-4-deoxy-L-arabinose transferase-like glycosyltransferase